MTQIKQIVNKYMESALKSTKKSFIALQNKSNQAILIPINILAQM